ncbi:hypothetical protein Ancab_033464, partial [Ancistrocladus abbreviatus]
ALTTATRNGKLNTVSIGSAESHKFSAVRAPRGVGCRQSRLQRLKALLRQTETAAAAQAPVQPLPLPRLQPMPPSRVQATPLSRVQPLPPPRMLPQPLPYRLQYNKMELIVSYHGENSAAVQVPEHMGKRPHSLILFKDLLKSGTVAQEASGHMNQEGGASSSVLKAPGPVLKLAEAMAAARAKDVTLELAL